MSSTKTVSFTLGQYDRHFISDMVERGRFTNNSEVIRAGLRMLEDYESNQKINRLRALISEGDTDINNGRITEYDNAEELISDIKKLRN